MTDEPRYTIANEVEEVALQVMADFADELDHLSEGKIVYLFTTEEIRVRGRIAAACVTMPDAQGQNKNIYPWALECLFGAPVDVIMIVDHAFWGFAAQNAKMALVFHELLHIAQKETKDGKPCFSKETGAPCLQLIDHDIGEFFSVVEKFGAWDGGLKHLKKIMEGKDDTNVAEG